MSTFYNNLLKFNILVILTMVAISNLSCKKFVDVGSPVDQLTTKKVFADSANATAAVLGIYIDMASSKGILYGGPSLFGGLLSDELKPVSAGRDIDQFYLNAVSPSTNNAIYSNLWRHGYVLIYRANACLEGINESQGLSELLKKQLTGEVKFMRALIYFYLVNFFGDVPLVITTDYQVSSSLPRSANILVYEQILNDLLDAKDLVKDNYVTTGRLRPNKSVITALLARVYLYQKQWAKAEEAASEVIGQTNLYALVSDLAKVFEPNSREAIWQIDPIDIYGFETPDGVTFIPSSASAIPTYNITQSLLTSFESSDGRRSSWIAKRIVNVSGQPTDFYYPFKYKLRNSGWTTTPLESYSMFRLAELYLIRAEARTQQNNIDPAKDDLNAIRNRAGLGNTLANSQTSLLEAIYKEKQIEFFCEWGHRWFDLKRTERINSVMPVVAIAKNSTWNTNKQLLPIPFQEITANPFLVQNPGYN